MNGGLGGRLAREYRQDGDTNERAKTYHFLALHEWRRSRMKTKNDSEVSKGIAAAASGKYWTWNDLTTDPSRIPKAHSTPNGAKL